MPAVALIAHVSRCGSTLVSECMRELGDVAVLFEPRAVSESLHRAAESGASRVAIKLGSTDTLQLPDLRAALPDAPLMLLTRDPVEVLVSHARIRPGFAYGRDLAFCAEMLTRYFEMMLAEERHAAVVLDYASLNARTIADAIEVLLGAVTPTQYERIEARSRINAKQPHRGLFQRDVDEKQAAATPELRAMVAEATRMHRQLLAQQRCGEVVRT